MSARQRTRRPPPGRRARQRGLRRVAPAVLRLVGTLRAAEPDDVEVQISSDTADAIARIAARRTGSITTATDHAARSAVATRVAVARETARQWSADGWQAAREGLIGTTAAQALSDQTGPPDAA